MKRNENRALAPASASARTHTSVGTVTVLPAVMLAVLFFPVFLIRAADKAVRNF